MASVSIVSLTVIISLIGTYCYRYAFPHLSCWPTQYAFQAIHHAACFCVASPQNSQLHTMLLNQEATKFEKQTDKQQRPDIDDDTTTVPVLTDIHLKIANGKPALDNQFPFVASVALWDIHTCGASLIEPRVVLTAAHCVWDKDYKTLRDPTAVSVTLGNPTLTYGQKFNVERIVVPAQFDSSRSYFADIAVILLNDSVLITQETVKLPIKYKESKIYTAVGWGYTANSTMLSPTLQYAFVNGLSESKCIAELARLKLGSLPEDHFCAGLNSNHADTCKGDSGSFFNQFIHF